MRLKFFAALAAIPFATSANAANVYAACYYRGDQGLQPITQLFTLKGDALEDYYREWSYEKNRAWEEQFAEHPHTVRYVTGYLSESFVGQFRKFAEEKGDSHAQCWVATSRDRALAWFAKEGASGRHDTATIQDWRPSKAGVIAVSDWIGRPTASVTDQKEPETDMAGHSVVKQDDENASAVSDPPRRPKKSNAQADAEYETAMAEYNRKLAARQEQVEEHQRAQDAVARQKEEQRLAAERAAADYQRQLAAHARQVREQQLEYQKQLARPAGVPNAIYRGFVGLDCDGARRSALHGAGTTSGSQFKEVRAETSDGNCVVQGWWWDTSKGTATRQ